MSGKEVGNYENKENESWSRISPNLNVFQTKQKKVEGESSKEEIIHASEHLRRYISMVEHFAGIYLIPRSQHLQQRRGCILIPAVHQKEHFWKKQSA